MMRNLSLSFLASLLMAACTYSPTLVDEKFGASLRQSVLNQIVSSERSLQVEPAIGTDGQSAKSAVDRYQKSFEIAPASSNVFTIGVGGASNAGSR